MELHQWQSVTSGKPLAARDAVHVLLRAERVNLPRKDRPDGVNKKLMVMFCNPSSTSADSKYFVCAPAVCSVCGMTPIAMHWLCSW